MKKLAAFIVILLIITAGAFGIIKLKNSRNTENKTEQTAQDQNTQQSSNTSEQNNAESDIILFIGQGCPHCQKVEDFIKNNKIEEKIKFQTREVWYNKDNAALMQKKADICKISPDNLGVPLLFNAPESKCYIGEVEITDFFNKKINGQ